MKNFIGCLFLVLIASSSFADNSKCWGGVTGEDDKSRPDIVCKELTQEFVLSFKGQSREEVIERMTSPGAQPSSDVIHYLSNAEHYDGDINFKFSGNKVTAITAVIGENNYNLVWEANGNFFCSDFPSSKKKCPKGIITPTAMLGLKADSPEAVDIDETIKKYTQDQ